MTAAARDPLPMHGNSHSRSNRPGFGCQEHPIRQSPRTDGNGSAVSSTVSFPHDRLEHARLASNAPSLKPLSLNKPVAEAITRLAGLIQESGADVTVDRLPEIEGDGDHLAQLFKSLIANGIRFCSGKTPKIEIKSFRDEGRKIVQVSDYGAGIDPADYGKICRMLQSRQPPDEPPESGLGLYVCQRIMESHGGSIEIESLVGQGSTFTLRF